MDTLVEFIESRCEPGFQPTLLAQPRIPGAICTASCFSKSMSLLAIGDDTGHILIFQDDMLKPIPIRDKQGKDKGEDLLQFESPIRSIQFVDSFSSSIPSVPHGHPIPEREYEKLLLVGTDEGAVHILQLDLKMIESPVFYRVSSIVPRKLSSMVYFVVIDSEGQPVGERDVIVRMTEESANDANFGEAAAVFQASSSSAANTSSASTPAETNSHFLIVVLARAIRIFLDCTDKKFKKIEMESDQPDIRAARLVRTEGGVALACILANGDLKIVSLPKLTEIKREHIFSPEEMRHLEHIFIDEKGAVYSFSSGYPIFRHSILAEENALRMPNSLGKLATRDRRLCDRPVLEPKTSVSMSFFKYLFNPSSDKVTQEQLDELFGGSAPQAKNAGKLQNDAGSVSAAPGSSSGGKREQEAREKLLGKAAATTPGEVGGSKSAASATSGAHLAAHEAKQRLEERGEKLSKMESAFGDLESNSKDFLAQIQEINRRQAEKKWYEF